MPAGGHEALRLHPRKAVQGLEAGDVLSLQGPVDDLRDLVDAGGP